MFDLHPLTFWGIMVIAFGTIIGTILIQRGNILKSKESSQEMQSRLNELKEQNKEIKSQNENLKSLTEQQSIVLGTQRDLIKHQINFSKDVEYTNFLSNFMEYQILVHEYFNVGYYIYQSSFRKEEFLQLTRNQVEQLENNINQAIDNIRKNKFVSTNNPIDTRWIELQGQLFGDLYFFRYQVGDRFKENDLSYTIDNSKRENRYDSLQNFLKENDKQRTLVVEETIKQIQKKYSTANK